MKPLILKGLIGVLLAGGLVSAVVFIPNKTQVYIEPTVQPEVKSEIIEVVEPKEPEPIKEDHVVTITPVPVSKVQKVFTPAPTPKTETSKIVDRVPKPSPVTIVDNSRVMEEATAKELERQRIEQAARAKECQIMLDHYNAELFKFKESSLSDLRQIRDGMEQAKAIYQTRLENAYGNQILWDTIMAEMDINSAKWGELINQITAEQNRQKARIESLPLC